MPRRLRRSGGSGDKNPFQWPQASGLEKQETLTRGLVKTMSKMPNLPKVFSAASNYLSKIFINFCTTIWAIILNSMTQTNFHKFHDCSRNDGQLSNSMTFHDHWPFNDCVNPTVFSQFYIYHKTLFCPYKNTFIIKQAKTYVKYLQNTYHTFEKQNENIQLN